MLVILAWAGTAAIALTYLYGAIKNKFGPFNWANLVGGIPILTLNVVTDGWPQVALNVFFMVIAAIGIGKSKYGKS